MSRRRAHGLPALFTLLAQLVLCVAASWPAPSEARTPVDPARYFIMGDGTLAIRSTKNRHRFRGRYRLANGRYAISALRRINRVFGTRYRDPAARVSLRLIEVLSFLRKRLHGGVITVSSGYRSPRYNRALRKKGRTVAKASLHQYGMAADLKIAGVGPKALWLLAKKHRVGGAGYYGSPWVHIDVGPPRSWTQGSANVRKGSSDHNKRIIVIPEADRYRVGETMSLRLARMTAYPLGVARRWVLERQQRGAFKALRELTPALPRGKRRRGRRRAASKGCVTYKNLAALVGFELPLAAAKAGRYRLRVRFCAIKWPAMPKEIVSRPFEVLATSHGR